MQTRKTINIPGVKGDIPNKRSKLPVPIDLNKVDKFSYSFFYLDRNHRYFNLGGIKDGWFLDLLDCLKEASEKTIPELKTGKFKLHPVDWTKTNTPIPSKHSDEEFWQFRLSKGNGRIVGFRIDSVFYIVWLDPHHNLTNSEGYGTCREYDKPRTEYEELIDSNTKLLEENNNLREIFDCCEPLKCPINDKNKRH